MTGLAVDCDELRHVYQLDGETQVALDDLTLKIEAGSTVAVLGPSGAGKSTLMTLLAGLQRATSGRLFVGDHFLPTMTEQQLLRMRSRDVGFVLQNPIRNLLPYGDAEDNVRFAQRSAGKGTRMPAPRQLLDRLGLGRLANTKVDRLSGGERQRLALAVGVARAPGLLLVDEPTSQLDLENRDRVVRLLGEISDDFGTTIVAVTHDAAVAHGLQRTLTLSEGRIQ